MGVDVMNLIVIYMKKTKPRQELRSLKTTNEKSTAYIYIYMNFFNLYISSTTYHNIETH